VLEVDILVLQSLQHDTEETDHDYTVPTHWYITHSQIHHK